jgi:hypothetical protein
MKWIVVISWKSCRWDSSRGRKVAEHRDVALKHLHHCSSLRWQEVREFLLKSGDDLEVLRWRDWRRR